MTFQEAKQDGLALPRLQGGKGVVQQRRDILPRLALRGGRLLPVGYFLHHGLLPQTPPRLLLADVFGDEP